MTPPQKPNADETQRVSRRQFLGKASLVIAGTTLLSACPAAPGSPNEKNKAEQGSGTEKAQAQGSGIEATPRTEVSPSEMRTEAIQDSTVPDAATLDANAPGDLTPEKPKDTVPQNCDPTEDNIEGPFYCENTPSRTTIALPNEPGTRLWISGVIYGRNCQPLANATVEVWHADDKGNYDNTCQQQGQETQYKLRAQMKTNAKGEYAYETIIPGRYLNGAEYRPAHIHYKVASQGHRPLTTQLYFKGDPFIPKDAFVKPSLVVPLRAKGKGKSGVFDIHLA